MLIQAYQTSWVEDFSRIRAVIDEAIYPLSVSIEHVGSTAVPNLAAKPVIDIDIVYGGNTAFEDIKTGLEKIGYFHNGNQGILNREVFKRGKMPIFPTILDEIVHHLYVCPSDSEELQKHILFRDYLVENKDARVQYQNLKSEIGEEANHDKKKYAALKEVKASPFINSIIEKCKSNLK